MTDSNEDELQGEYEAGWEAGVKEERERCARLAEKLLNYSSSVVAAAALALAIAIRKGPDTKGTV
jgi:hypothetical protein